MRVHVEVLGWLHVIWGAFAVLTGASLVVMGVGAGASLVSLGSIGPAERVGVWVLVGCGVTFALAGAAMVTVGRALHRRARRGRTAALLLAVPNLVVAPFGTALAVYTWWVLLNDDARAEFGRPLRGGPPRAVYEGGA